MKAISVPADSDQGRSAATLARLIVAEVIGIVKCAEVFSERSEAWLCEAGMGAWGKGPAFEASCPTLAPMENADQRGDYGTCQL